MADKHVTGPIQVFVIGFDKFEATGRIMAELRRVRKRGVIRLVDVIFVQKDRHGSIENSMHLTDLSEDERMRLGSIAGGLIGLHAGGVEGMVEGEVLGALAVAERDAGLSVDRMQELAESIPAGGAAAILVIEHHWAASLRDAIADAGGRALMQAMIRPTRSPSWATSCGPRWRPRTRSRRPRRSRWPPPWRSPRPSSRPS